MRDCAGFLHHSAQINVRGVRVNNHAEVIWTEASCAALVRLLEYLSEEISAALGDESLSEGLAKCIASILASRQLSHDQIYPGPAVTSH